MESRSIANNTDMRLWGSALVRFFRGSCRSFKFRVFVAFQPGSCKTLECIKRLFLALILTVVIPLAFIPALIGRCVQLCHYRAQRSSSSTPPINTSIRTEKIDPSNFRAHMGMSLNDLPLKKVNLSEDHRLYHWTKASQAIVDTSVKIFPEKAAYRGDGFYLSESKMHTQGYGCCRFAVHLEVKAEEICEVEEPSDTSIAVWSKWERNQLNRFLKEKSGGDFKTAMKELFLLNGFKAQRYNYDFDHAICVYDEKCVDFKKVSRKRNGIIQHGSGCVSKSQCAENKEDNEKEWKVKKTKSFFSDFFF